MPARTMENLPDLYDDLLPHQDELQQLGEIVGIHMDPRVFRILVSFLNMGIDANTVYNLLKIIKRSRSKSRRSRGPMERDS